MLKIYTTDYNEVEDGEFSSIEAAAEHVFAYLPSDDFPYMIGTELEIGAFVFQGAIYANAEKPPLWR